MAAGRDVSCVGRRDRAMRVARTISIQRITTTVCCRCLLFCCCCVRLLSLFVSAMRISHEYTTRRGNQPVLPVRNVKIHPFVELELHMAHFEMNLSFVKPC